MKIKDIFYLDSDIAIYSIVDHVDTKEFLENRVTPIKSKILSEEFLNKKFCPDNRVQGAYLIKAKIINDNENKIIAFLIIVMPEAVIDGFVYKEDNQIYYDSIGYCKFRLGKDLVSSVAVNNGSKYESYYSKSAPEIGINLLKEAISKSKRKGNFARCLGYICRDEGRFIEAINAFSIAINEGENFVYDFIERARLYDKIKDLENAERDWNFIKNNWGEKTVEYYRIKLGS